MADQRAKEVHHRSVTDRRRLADQERVEMSDQERVEMSDRRADFIRCENHFNFVKMHYLTHLASH